MRTFENEALPAPRVPVLLKSAHLRSWIANRDILVAQLGDVLQGEGIVYIHGMSGMGKTWVARQLIGAVKDKYNSIIWLNPGEFDDHSDLRGIRITRFGQSLNLKHRLTEARCLLVVDDLRTGLQELLNQMGGTKSHCLVTSQLAPECHIPAESKCPLSPLERENITAVLQPPEELDEQVVEKIFRKTGGHPLSLAIIRDTAKAEGVTYGDLAREMDSLPDWEDAGTSVRLIDRILSRHSALVARELSVLKWLGSRQVDPHLLRAMGTATPAQQQDNRPNQQPRQSNGGGDKASNKQIKFVTDLATQRGIALSEINADVQRKYGVGGLYDLTRKQASELLDELNGKKKAA